jgi:iron complex outermembrane receptor protein
MNIGKSTFLLASALGSGISTPTWAQADPASSMPLATSSAPTQSTPAADTPTKTSVTSGSAAVPSPIGDTGSVPGVGDIIVTAQKRSESIMKVGAPIVALTDAALQEKNIRTPLDIATSVPGLNYSPSNTGTTVYTLRGVGFTDGTLSAYPDVTVYLDQVPLPFPVLAQLANFDLSRAEVLVGPQGTLFGANATGGAINYVAATPTSTLQGGATVDYSRFNNVLVDGFISGPISSNLDFRLAGRVNTGDDWQYSYTRKDTTGHTSTWALRALLDWHPTDRLTLNLDVNGWRDKTDPQQPQFYRLNIQNPGLAPDYEINYPPAPHNPRAASFDPDLPLYNDTYLIQTSLHARYELTDTISLTSLSSYIHAKRDAFQQDGGADFEQSQYGSFGTFNDIYQELRLDNGTSGRLRWTLGGNFAQDNVNEGINARFSQSSVFFATGLTGDRVTLKQDTNNYAGFAAADFDVLPNVTLKGGLRYTQTNRKGVGCVADIGDGSLDGFFDALQRLFSGRTDLPPLQQGDCVSINPATGLSGTYRNKLDQHNLSYRAGIDWKPSNAILLYANISKGYKAGGFPSLGASTWTQFQPVKQESVLDYEGGIKARLFGNKVQLTADGFYYDYRNKQLKSKLIDPVFGALDGLVNIPKSSVRGGEFSVSTAPLSGVTPTLSVTYLDATVDKFTGVNAGGLPPTDYSGTASPFVSKWSVNAGIGYRRPLFEGWSGFANADLTYRSHTNALVGDPAAYNIPSYALLDLRAGIESDDKRWKFMVYGKNVTDKYYITNVGLAYDYIVRFTGYPATYGVSISRKF